MEHRLFWGEHPPNHRESVVNHTSTPICPYVWNICSVDEYINHYKSSKSWCHPPNSCQIRGLEDYLPLKPSDSHGQTVTLYSHISHPILSSHIPFSTTLSKWNTTKIIYKSSINIGALSILSWRASCSVCRAAFRASQSLAWRRRLNGAAMFASPELIH